MSSNSEGNKKENSPKKTNKKTHPNMTCFSCGEKGHHKDDCPSPNDELPFKRRIARPANKHAHTTANKAKYIFNQPFK